MCHERTKHMDCYFIRERIQENFISTSYVKTWEQLADIFLKALNGAWVNYLCNKMDIINIYALDLGGALPNIEYIPLYSRLIIDEIHKNHKRDLSDISHL